MTPDGSDLQENDLRDVSIDSSSAFYQITFVVVVK